MSNIISKWNVTTVPEEELRLRRSKVINVLQENNAMGMMFFSAQAIQYLTGGRLIPTERPMTFILKSDGQSAMMVPRLELEHAHHAAKCTDKIVCYPEYPTDKHPMKYLAELLAEMGLANAAILADSDGYGAHYGYRGPKVSDLCPQAKITLRPFLVEELMRIKTPYEQILIKESARWGNLAHALLQEYTVPGAKEVPVADRASCEASHIMLKTLGPDYIPGESTPASAGYRGQIGKNSYHPHAITNNATFKKGDTLVTGASANILSYGSELERVFFVGEPSQVQAEFYKHAVALQDVAFNLIKPGIKCSDVDKEVMRYFKENNLMEYWRHHTGHALGFGMHEAPFFDSADDTIIEKGMVFSVEPGLYVKDVGGFRLSDTVLVTDDGIEMVTYYPREIDRVICGE